MPPWAHARAAAGLATFLLALHALPVEIGRTCGLEVLSASALAEQLQQETRDTLWEHLEPEDQRRLRAFLAVEARKRKPSRPPALIHCDIAPGHVLYDPATGRLTGIIDFGDIVIGDPARDFIYIYEDFGPDLLDEVLNRYAGSHKADLLRDMRKEYLLETTTWTVEMLAEGQAEAAQRGLAEMRRELAWK